MEEAVGVEAVQAQARRRRVAPAPAKAGLLPSD